jgi:hypothetical protein
MARPRDEMAAVMLTAEMLELRLALIARLHRVELEVARDEHARAAAALVRRKTHELGNAVQIVQLSALELERRVSATEIAELVADLRGGAEQAASALGELLAAAAPAMRTLPGPPVAPSVRAAIDEARGALAAHIEASIELADDVRTRATADELTALVVAALLATDDATRVSIVVRPRTIAGKPYAQLLWIDDRRDRDEAVLPPLLAAIAERAGGEASLSPGRDGLELAIELPAST